MSSDDENYGSFNPAAHKKLLSEINEIVKFQHIKKPVRSEPALKNSEFHLVKSKPSFDEDDGSVEKSTKADKKSVSISHVAQTVQKNTKQKQIGKQLKNAFKSENVLAKPLEKVYADKIQRTIAYDNTKARLGRWDAVVTKNQNAEQLQFPMNLEKTSFKSKKDKEISHFRFKTQMMKDLEEIHNECFPKPKEVDVPETPIELLSLEEMKERRKELGRLKLKESHKIAKKRMQGKIKSKKYHKLKKREDIKQKIKDFENLKTTNPELALKELEKIDRQRVKERTTLRHKNTGTWAKNLQVRAKYDENVRQDLEVQLALGRELTQKNRQQDSSDSDSDEDTVTVQMKDAGNPWLGQKEAADPLDEVFSGYKKFWEQHNENEKKLKRVKRDLKEVEVKKEDSEDENVSENDENSSENDEKSSENGETSSMSDDENPSKFINDLFDEAEEKIAIKMDSKLSSLKPKLLESQEKSKKKKKRGANVHDASYLGFEKKARLGDVDEALMEGNEGDENKFTAPSKKLLAEVKRKKKEKESFMKGSGGDINPESFLSVKSKHLIMAIPKMQEFDDADEDFDVERANKMSLAEAFEDDDILNDFEAEVEEEFKRNLGPEETTLPGWGSWGGSGVKEKKQKPQKKIPEVKKKDRIIISSAVNEKLQKHLISTVPFPFKSVRDFEASMRVPIGKDFIPETAHRKLTLPSVVTKAGTVIEPMSEEILVNQKKLSGGGKNKFMKKGKKAKKTRK